MTVAILAYLISEDIVSCFQNANLVNPSPNLPGKFACKNQIGFIVVAVDQ